MIKTRGREGQGAINNVRFVLIILDIVDSVLNSDRLNHGISDLYTRSLDEQCRGHYAAMEGCQSQLQLCKACLASTLQHGTNTCPYRIMCSILCLCPYIYPSAIQLKSLCKAPCLFLCFYSFLSFLCHVSHSFHSSVLCRSTIFFNFPVPFIFQNKYCPVWPKFRFACWY